MLTRFCGGTSTTPCTGISSPNDRRSALPITIPAFLSCSALSVTVVSDGAGAAASAGGSAVVQEASVSSIAQVLPSSSCSVEPLGRPAGIEIEMKDFNNFKTVGDLINLVSAK